MYKFLILIFCSALIFQSCSVENEIHFNEDWSGSFHTEYDLSAMLNDSDGKEDLVILREGLNALKKDNHSEAIDNHSKAIEKTLDSIRTVLSQYYVTNFDVHVKDNDILVIDYDFDDYLTLSDFGEIGIYEAMSELDQFNPELIHEIEFKDDIRYSLEDKDHLLIHLAGFHTYDDLIFHYTTYVDPDLYATRKEEEEILAEFAKIINPMFNYKNAFKFERKIKRVKSDIPYSLKQNRTKLVVKYDIVDYVKALKKHDKIDILIEFE